MAAFWARTPWACPPPRRSSPPGTAAMDVLGITLVSNMAAGVLPQKLTEQEVLDAAEAAKEKFSGLLLACLAHLDEA